ncbi:MAG: hypothetical protein HYZ63_02175 [Candidatus Andersenbacteria bacterium]|nr:hypothetical protein [Candidatus Andersenbacteria bacterium]
MATVQSRKRCQPSQSSWLRNLWSSFSPFTQWMCLFFASFILLIGLLLVITYGGAHLRAEKPLSRVAQGTQLSSASRAAKLSSVVPVLPKMETPVSQEDSFLAGALQHSAAFELIDLTTQAGKQFFFDHPRTTEGVFEEGRYMVKADFVVAGPTHVMASLPGSVFVTAFNNVPLIQVDARFDGEEAVKLQNLKSGEVLRWEGFVYQRHAAHAYDPAKKDFEKIPMVKIYAVGCRVE